MTDKPEQPVFVWVIIGAMVIAIIVMAFGNLP